MRILVVFILFLFLGQQTTVNGQQTLCTVPEPVEGTTLGASTSSATAYTRTVDCCPLSVDYYENQIRLADSLYKNYLPQSNFEEVKAAVEFFDSLRLTTVNSQQTTDIFHRIFPNKRQRTMCTVPEPVEGTTLGASTSSATAYTRTVDCCPLSVDFYESQIRKADSLYKNYLPQYNFEEVKAAMEFFDSYQPSAISGQRWRLFDKEADDENRLIAESRQLTAAKAHYYHAVGLTEKDDIVGACEHYLIALEIMEPLVETSPLWRLMANVKRQKTY